MKILDYDQFTFLHYEDFECQVLMLTIAKVKTELVCYEGKLSPKEVIYFEETEKVFLLCNSFASHMAGIFGGQADNWIGEKIALFDQTPFEAVRISVMTDEMSLFYASEMLERISSH